MQTTRLDPIIAEVRAIRDEYTERFDNDVGRIFRDLRARQDASDRGYVRHSPRRPAIDPNGPRRHGAGEGCGPGS